MKHKAALTGAQLKKQNRNRIFRYLHRIGRVTKQDIMQELKLSLPTVTANIDELTDMGLVEERGSFGNTGGRRARGYAIVPGSRFAMGAEISQEHIGMALIDLSGEVVGHRRVYISYRKSDAYYREASDLIRSMAEAHGILPEQVLGVGISMQGIPDPFGSSIRYGKILQNSGEQIEVFARYLPYPCRFYHDADSGAFAELWVRPELENAVYVSLSAHLGASVIIDRKLYRGADGYGGKMEHMTLVPDGDPCYCGQRGCADAYCASVLLADSGGRVDTFFEALKNGGKIQREVWEGYKNNLAVFLHNIRITFACDIIVGGFMSRYLEDYLEELEQIVYAKDTFAADRTYLSVGRFQSEVTAAGSALQILEVFLSEV